MPKMDTSHDIPYASPSIFVFRFYTYFHAPLYVIGYKVISRVQDDKTTRKKYIMRLSDPTHQIDLVT